MNRKSDSALLWTTITLIIINQLDIDVNAVTINASLIKDLGADSLDEIEILMALENEWDISIPDEVTDKLATVGQIYNYLAEIKGLPIDSEVDITIQRRSIYDSLGFG